MTDPLNYVRFSVGVVHKPVLERRECFIRLQGQLAEFNQGPDYVADKPAKSFHDWSTDVWRGTLKDALERGSTHAMFLNDDVILHPNFGHHLLDMVRVRPTDVICLHQPHHVFAEVTRSWAASYDGLVGPAHIWPVPVLQEFLAFREEAFIPAVRETLDWPEDAQQATFCLATRRDILHPVPALVDIDVSVRSCYGHDGDPYARPWVRPWILDGTEPSQWNWNQEPKHVGLLYGNYHWSLISHLTKAARRKYSGIERAYEIANSFAGPRLRYNASPQVGERVQVRPVGQALQGSGSEGQS